MPESPDIHNDRANAHFAAGHDLPTFGDIPADPEAIAGSAPSVKIEGVSAKPPTLEPAVPKGKPGARMSDEEIKATMKKVFGPAKRALGGNR